MQSLGRWIAGGAMALIGLFALILAGKSQDRHLFEAMMVLAIGSYVFVMWLIKTADQGSENH